MIESLGSLPANTTFSQAASPASSAAGGWGSLGLAGEGGLPSVGPGRDLAWARTWDQLSTRVSNLDADAMRFLNKPMDPQNPQSIREHFVGLAEMSRRLHATAAELQVVMHLVQSAHGVTDKLMRQQG